MGTVEKGRSVTVSSRLDRSLYEILRNDALSKGISLNSHLSSILKRYISWEKYAEEVGFIPLAKETIRQIFEELHDTQIQASGERLGRTLPRELITLMFNRIDYSTIIAFLETTLSRYGMVQHNINGTSHDFIIYHNVNKNFSNKNNKQNLSRNQGLT